MADNYDVIIVGAGMAGSTLACALASGMPAEQSLRVALVESQPLPADMPPVKDGVDNFDTRVSALTNATCQFLQELAVWPTIAAQRCCAFQQMQVWDANGTGEIHFDATEVGESQLGYIVENRITTAALINHLRTYSQVEIIDGIAVRNMVLPESDVADGDVQVELSNDSFLSCKLVVAADGAASALREMADIPLRQWDYQQDAVVCTIETERSHQHTAWQSFTADGPLAYLPLASLGDRHFCSIVWSQTRARAAELMALDDQAFCAQLAAALECRLGGVSAVSGRRLFPLQQQHAVDYVKPGFALLADAAHVVHPLAGQGINLGLADARLLAKLMINAANKNRPISELSVLRRYQRERKLDNLAMMAIIEGFKRFYEPLPLPLMWLRNWGMKQTNRQQWLKQRILNYAMGS